VITATHNWIGRLLGPGLRGCLRNLVSRLVLCAAQIVQPDRAPGVPTDELIRRFQQGQPRAFEALFERYKDYVYRVAFFITRNRYEAEEAVQETFLDVHKALPRYDIEGAARFETWLYRVTVNRCKMRLRRKRPPTEDWDDISERLERLPTPEADNPETVVLRNDQAATLWRLVDTLPDEHRAVVALRYLQDLSYQEIAEVLGISLGTVKSRLYNAHKKLRVALE
jgi:RNA polymerase sigma-70 factor, ECF subfamily